MQLRRWNELPGAMRTREVRKYYNIIKKRQMSLKIKRLFEIPDTAGDMTYSFPAMTKVASSTEHTAAEPTASSSK